jgi:hypothetical protein
MYLALVDHDETRPMSFTLIALAAFANLSGPPFSGVYVGASADTVQLVQIVRTPDGHLAGRVEEVTLTPDGSIKDSTLPLDGASDGDQLVLTPKSALLEANATSMTGFVSGDLLDLSWQGGHRTLKRADAYAFEAAVTGLKARSAMIVAQARARALEAKRANDLNTLLSVTQTLADEVAGIGRDLPSVEGRLAAIQASYHDLQVAAARDRHRQQYMLAQPGFAVAAMRSGTNAQGAEVQLAGLHGEAAALHGELALRFKTTRGRVSETQVACRSLGTGPEPQVGRACLESSMALAELDALAGRATTAFNSAEAVYQHPADYVSPGRALFQKLFGQN